MTLTTVRARDALLAKIEMVAALEQHFVPIMEMKLKSMPLTDEAREQLGCSTNFDWWTRSLGPEHLRMTSIIRLATEIELGLKGYYVEKKCYSSFSALDADSKIRSKTIFQRLSLSDQQGVVQLFRSQLSVDLSSFVSFRKIRELFALRHLYAHRAGVVDEQFLRQYEDVTGQNLRAHPCFGVFPAKDVVWFCSRDEVNNLINACQSFARELP